MVEILLSQQPPPFLSAKELLEPGEVVVVVDDSPEIILLLSHYLNNQGITTVQANNAEELFHLLATLKVALVLLDIGLPDRDGSELLNELVPVYPDLGIIMVTGTTDISVALSCLRQGADDYLTKPVSMKQFNHTIHNTLQKRRLAINNRIFQLKLQKTNARMQFLHHLTLKMNTAYLNTVELRGILQAILVGITSSDGLRFNRAFLALYNRETGFLEGKLAIGPDSREAAGRVWADIQNKGLHLEDILETIRKKTINEDYGVNRLIQMLNIPPQDESHVLLHASIQKKSILVVNAQAEGCTVPNALVAILGEASFAVVPLFSPSRSLGVMIVDNFVTGAPITPEDVADLEIFANQASLAIEHSHLYDAMTEKILALETVTQELEKSKDLLLEAERTAAIGQMAAQLLHGIRNPLTSIGGTARLLAKKVSDPYISNFLGIITKEAGKIESILDDLFSYVNSNEIKLEPKPLFPLLRKSLLMFFTAMKKSNIEYLLDLNEPGPTLFLDEKQIRQVFLHLLRNAIEAMPQGGLLHIHVSEDVDNVQIFIKDTGPGISKSTQARLMEPFFTTKTYGTGMGLTLVDQIVTAHNGSFGISNDPNGGTLVTVKLPKPRPGTQH